MAQFPEMPARVVDALDSQYPGFRDWSRNFQEFMQRNFSTDQDITIVTAGKGIVISNAAGTITKRLRINDLGTDILLEDI